MKLIRNISLAIYLLLSGLSFACLNGVEQQLSTGTTLYIDHEGLIPYGHEFWLKEENRDLEKLDSLYQLKSEVKYLTEKGVVLIIQKKYEDAIQLYLEIEKTNPNQYSTASNLGTAYELFGDNNNALKWIEKALQLNPDSHQKSEWIHINILKIKLGQTKLNSQNLIGTDFGSDDIPTTNLSEKQLDDLMNQMYFQLNERRSFVKPKDEIMAQLLFDYGNVLLLNKKYSEAKEVYKVATEYGFNNPILNKRLNQIKEPNSEDNSTITEIFKNHWDTIMISIISIVVFVLIYLKKERNKRK